MKKRLTFIDGIKTIAMVMVVLTHCLFSINGVQNTFLFNMIWLLQMPLFMISSGFVFNHNIQTIKQAGFKILRLVLQLVYPCLTFLIVNIFINGSFNLVGGFKSFFQNPETNLWYLWVLFMISVISIFVSFFVTKIGIKKGNYILFFLLMALVGLLLLCILISNKEIKKTLGFGLLVYYLPFFLLGTIFRLVYDNRNKIKKIKILKIVFYVFSTAIFLFIAIYFKGIYYFDDFAMKELVIRTTGSLSGCISMFLAMGFICKNKIISKMTSVGKYSLQTYYLHICIRNIIQLNLSKYDLYLQWLFGILYTILLLVSVALLCVAFYNIPYANLILFGKSNSRYQFEKKLPVYLR